MFFQCKVEAKSFNVTEADDEKVEAKDEAEAVEKNVEAVVDDEVDGSCFIQNYHNLYCVQHCGRHRTRCLQRNFK